MARFLIQAQQRQGFKGLFRAARFWSSDQPIAVELVDQIEDPAPASKDEVPIRLGSGSFAALKADGRLSIISVGGGDDASKVRAAELEEALTAERARTAVLEARVTQLEHALKAAEDHLGSPMVHLHTIPAENMGKPMTGQEMIDAGMATPVLDPGPTTETADPTEPAKKTRKR